MQSVYPWLIVAPPILFLILGAIPSSWSNRRPRLVCELTVLVAALSLVLAIGTAAALACTGPLDTVLIAFEGTSRVTLGVYWDSLSAIMVLLVCFVGWIIARYATTHLEGDSTQGRFMRWLCFTLGSVLLLIVARNLITFTAAWIMTSLGLHQLLVHYSHRPAAVLAARKKFLISRLGDVMLAAAIVLTYREFGTFELPEIFAAAKAFAQPGSSVPGLVSAIALLYVAGAITKSTQFPFHSWLPDTMETPTPVSALMHAGIINAGGFLVIRLSPLISLSPIALNVLAVIGAVTAVFGATVMITQTSVKRSLAYSTIAQMGFMMMQCGLGAFSAAMLHIIAHSLYKAHAFLSSGSVVEAASRNQVTRPRMLPASTSALLLVAALSVAATICGGAAWAAGLVQHANPGWLVLTVIFTLAMSFLLWRSFTVGRWSVAIAGVGGALAMSTSYTSFHALIDHVLGDAISRSSSPITNFDVVFIAVVSLVFLALFSLHIGLTNSRGQSKLHALYVHASNGFYVDVAAHRLTAKLWPKPKIAAHALTSTTG